MLKNIPRWVWIRRPLELALMAVRAQSGGMGYQQQILLRRLPLVEGGGDLLHEGVAPFGGRADWIA